MRRRLQSPSLLADIDIREAAALAHRFQAELAASKSAVSRREFDWYPYDSFGTISVFDSVLTGANRWLRSLIGDEPVLDAGCGDGAVSFFLESLGARVYAVDHAPTNYNRMAGVKALKSVLRSSVRVASMDLDARPDFRECGLALMLGVLYHLKNPFGVLESLAAKAHYCLLTTAITRYSTDGRTSLTGLPVAFLAGRNGLRGDETNYWIFTEAALLNLIDRTGWEVADSNIVEDRESTLWGSQRDQRAFCLLRSRLRPPVERPQLVAGWHELENDAWRWTERRFSISLPAPANVKLRCTVPDVVPVPIALSCGGTTRTFPAIGDYDIEVPAGRGVLEFELDHALAPGPHDGRERGIIVRAVDL